MILTFVFIKAMKGRVFFEACAATVSGTSA